MIYTISRWILIGFFRLRLKIEITGLENIPKRGGFILAGNHVSNLDPLIIGSACFRKLNYMAKIELFRNFFLRNWLNAVGAFPVKRETADISAVKEALKRLAAGKGLLVFPEGSRTVNKNDNVSPQAGVGFLAYKSKVPVVPVCISGTENVMPKGAKSIKRGIVHVRFGGQIFIERRMPYQEIASMIMDKIRHLS